MGNPLEMGHLYSDASCSNLRSGLARVLQNLPPLGIVLYIVFDAEAIYPASRKAPHAL